MTRKERNEMFKEIKKGDSVQIDLKNGKTIYVDVFEVEKRFFLVKGRKKPDAIIYINKNDIETMKIREY